MKLLFLPHCLERETLGTLQEKGEKKGYQVHVVGGGSAVKRKLAEYSSSDSIQRIVGVACEDEIELAKNYTEYLRKKGADVVAVPLSEEGCKNTKVDLEKVLLALK